MQPKILSYEYLYVILDVWATSELKTDCKKLTYDNHWSRER